MSPAQRYFLYKTEPSTFSIRDLEHAPQQTTCWEGVRNYQARNMLRDRSQVGNPVLIYHSSVAIPGVVGAGIICRDRYPDPSQFDPTSPYFDPRASVSQPRWWTVDVQWRATFAHICTRAMLRAHPETQAMALLQRGSRLSVFEITQAEFQATLQLVQERWSPK